MPTFNFQGRNHEGKFVQGKRLSQTVDTLGAQLLNEGITPIKIEIEIVKSGIWKKLNDWFQRRKVNVDELAMFARQMHSLAKTGVPINTALRQLAENSRSISMTDGLYGIVEQLETGKDLASSMETYPNIFTPIMVSMIRVGQNTGHLDKAFLLLSQYLDFEATTVKQVKSSLRYPIIVFTSILVGMLIINIFVIPTFASLFAQSNIPLPTITVWLIVLSTFTTNYWMWIAGFVLVVVGWIYYYLHTTNGKLAWNRYQLKMPVFGTIMKRSVLLRFAQTFSLTMSSGLPLLECIRLVADSVENTFAKQQILGMQYSLEHGKNLMQAAADTALFTPLEIQMLAVSEESGELNEMLTELSTFYRREIDFDLKRLNDLIEPTLLAVLASMILLLAFAVYLPMWDLIKLVKV